MRPRLQAIAWLVGIAVGVSAFVSVAADQPRRSSVVVVTAKEPARPSAWAKLSLKSAASSLNAVRLPSPATAWTCDKCHTETSWRELPERVSFDHDLTGVPLTGGHAKARCSSCHKGHEGGGRVPRACVSCHKDGHRNELGNQCQSCHTTRSWQTPRRFEKHANTRFPLTGAHAMIDCASCHRGQARDQYSGTPTTCDGCHRATAERVVSFPHKGLPPGCNGCHSTFSWSPARFDHGHFWPLIGAHAAIKSDCSQCHKAAPGAAPNYTSAVPACESCHGQLVDKGLTDPDHKALGFSRTCDRCHTPTAWSALKSGWHDKSFPISNGDHQRYETTCSSCHPGGMGRGQFDCVNCHDGEHEKAKMDKEHDVAGYVWDNAACLSCHPNGKAE